MMRNETPEEQAAGGVTSDPELENFLEPADGARSASAATTQPGSTRSLRSLVVGGSLVTLLLALGIICAYVNGYANGRQSALRGAWGEAPAYVSQSIGDADGLARGPLGSNALQTSEGSSEAAAAAATGDVSTIPALSSQPAESQEKSQRGVERDPSTASEAAARPSRDEHADVSPATHEGHHEDASTAGNTEPVAQSVAVTAAPTVAPTAAPTEPPTSTPAVTSAPSSTPSSAPTPAPSPKWGDYTAMLDQIEGDAELHYATHDPDCERFALYGYTHWYGFGSQYNNMLFNMAVTIWENRTLVMMPGWMVDYRCSLSGDSYDSCFKAQWVGPKSCAAKLDKMATLRANYTNLPGWNCMQDPPFTCYTHHIKDLQAGGLQHVSGYCDFQRRYKQMPKPMGRHMYDFFEYKVYGIRKLWVLQDAVREQVEAWKRELDMQGPVCGFHVRRGDKVFGGMAEARKQEMTKYFEQVKESPVQCKTCYVASDNISGALEEFRAVVGDHLPNCEIKHLPDKSLTDTGYDWWNFRHTTQEQMVEQTLYLLGALEILSETDLFVGSYSSNIGRLVALLRASKGRSPESTYSVDQPQWDPMRRLLLQDDETRAWNTAMWD